MTLDAPPPFEVIQPDPNFAALGAALSYLAGKRPFSGYHLAQLTRQVERHLTARSVVVARGQGRLVGYFGWERMTREAVVAMSHERGFMPKDETLPPGPDIAWITVAGGEHDRIVRAMIRRFRQVAPGLAASGFRTKDGQPLRLIRPTRM